MSDSVSESGARRVGLPAPSYIPVARAAKLLGCSVDTVLRLIVEDGSLRAVRLKPRGWWKVEYASVVEHLQRIKNAGI